MTQLDLAFVMDCTHSMKPYIDHAKGNIKNIIRSLLSGGSRDVRFALVEYRDHPMTTAVSASKYHDFTSSEGTMASWLGKCTTEHGIDFAEAVVDGLRNLLRLSWREGSTKIVILIGDAPPHGFSCENDRFPFGCPCGDDPFDIVNKLASKEITMYVVGCEPNMNEYKDFFMGLAYITGGQYVPLASAENLAKIIVCSAEEEMTMEAVMKTEVGPAIKHLKESGLEFDEDLLELYLVGEMARKGITTKKLRRNNSSLGDVSDKAKVIAEMQDLAQYRGTDLSRARPSTSAGAVSADVFDVEESAVDYSQVQRMVQKSKMRNKALFDD